MPTAEPLLVGLAWSARGHSYVLMLGVILIQQNRQDRAQDLINRLNGTSVELVPSTMEELRAARRLHSRIEGLLMAESEIDSDGNHFGASNSRR